MGLGLSQRFRAWGFRFEVQNLEIRVYIWAMVWRSDWVFTNKGSGSRV